VSAIAARQVVKSFGSANAVDGISFEAPEGKFLVLLGPSGCGKSTTLRLVAGLEQVSSGSIEIAGVDVTNLPPSARRIAMVFQSYALFPHMSVAENIVFGLRVRSVPVAERDARLARVAGMLGLSGLLDRKPSQLSGGQQQRVALGRAIIAEAPVCLMDEPLSNLDAQLRQEMRKEIRALQAQLGITMVYVTHDQTEAMTMADQVILLRNGRIEQDAAPGELYARPASVFAARFVGTPPMNVMSAVPGAGAEVLLGVRPEDIRLAGEGVPAVVENVEYLGPDSIVGCRAGADFINARVPRRAGAAVGDRVHLAWDAGAEHRFDAKTEKRI
jgi:sn-glycerol 3-phosphate transport system ATP-binding protein